MKLPTMPTNQLMKLMWTEALTMSVIISFTLLASCFRPKSMRAVAFHCKWILLEKPPNYTRCTSKYRLDIGRPCKRPDGGAGIHWPWNHTKTTWSPIYFHETWIHTPAGSPASVHPGRHSQMRNVAQGLRPTGSRWSPHLLLHRESTPSPPSPPPSLSQHSCWQQY